MTSTAAASLASTTACNAADAFRAQLKDVRARYSELEDLHYSRKDAWVAAGNHQDDYNDPELCPQGAADEAELEALEAIEHRLEALVNVLDSAEVEFSR
jgi:hypothetical protein